MPFDSEPAAEVTARDRVMRLRDFLASLPDERFDMRWLVGGGFYGIPRTGERLNLCGTTACIAGWATYLYAPETHPENADDAAQEMLGLNDAIACQLFYPDNLSRYNATASQAVKVLDHYLESGEIDWSVAE